MVKVSKKTPEGDSKRKLIVTVFVTREEKVRLEQAAKIVGVGISTFMRFVALREAVRIDDGDG